MIHQPLLCTQNVAIRYVCHVCHFSVVVPRVFRRVKEENHIFHWWTERGTVASSFVLALDVTC
jgi:hypothetical protein